MTSAREEILGAIRKASPAARPLPVVPRFEEGWPATVEDFGRALAILGGTVERPEGELGAWIRARYLEDPLICSAVREVRGDLDPRAFASARDAERIGVAVVRAAFGVAETGSVFLSERELPFISIAYLAQHLVVLLDPSRIVPNLHSAYARPEFQGARYSVLMTGPSATADIQGVLVRGAQGVRSLTVVFSPGPS